MQMGSEVPLLRQFSTSVLNWRTPLQQEQSRALFLSLPVVEQLKEV